MDGTAHEITSLLGQVDDDRGVETRLFEVVETRLRRIATAQLRGQPADLTLQGTALVHDAFLKLLRGKNLSWENREQFFCVAARVMRQQLVDYARTRLAQKRGGGDRGLAFTDVGEPPARNAVDPHELVAVNDIFEVLQDKHPDVFRVFELHYFGGWELKEIAEEILDVPYTTVKRRWRMAKAWLHKMLVGDKDEQ